MHHRKHSLTAMIAGGATLATALVAGPAASAQTTEEKARQNEKNNMRNLGTGLGAAAILEALRGKGANALILGAGAAYSYKKYDDARKAQEKEEQLRNNNRRYGYNEYGESSRLGTASSASMAAPAAAVAPIDVYVDNEPVRFSDQRPEMTGGNVYVPMRGVLEKIGANVQWDAQTRSVIAAQGDKTVRMPVNGMATVNGRRMTLDTPAYIDKGRTMVPLRFLAETFGAQVAWDAQDRDVRISTTGERDAG